MKRTIVAVFGALLVLAACSSSSKSSSSSSSTSSASSASSSSNSSSAAAAGSTTSIGALAAFQHHTIGKKILVSDRSVALYMFEPDGSNTTSQVPSAIKANWPAVIATDPADLRAVGLDPTKVGVGQQPDGTKQLTYNGHLLYTYVGDTRPGDVNGQGLSGTWFVLSETGDKIAS